MEESPLEVTPTFAPKRNINKRFLYLIIAIVAVILLFLGFKFISGGKDNAPIEAPVITPIIAPTDTPTPTPSVSETPTPTETPTKEPTAKPTQAQSSVDPVTKLDRSDLSVTVQNGSGETGVAAKGSDILKNLGYTVSATGNADNFDYTNVTVKIKAASSKFLPLLKKDLSSDYTVDSATSDLDDSFSTDALVIIGK